jgi:hypothetical protein
LQNKVSQKSYRDRKKRKAEQVSAVQYSYSVSPPRGRTLGVLVLELYKYEYMLCSKLTSAAQMETAVEEAIELNIVLQRKLKDAEDRNLRLARENGTLERKVIEMERAPSASASMGSAGETHGQGSRDGGIGSGGDGGDGRNHEAEMDQGQQEQERAQITSTEGGQAGEAMPVDHTQVEEVGVERDAKSEHEASQAASKEEKSHPGQAGVEEVELDRDTAGAFMPANHAQAILHAQADSTRPATPAV